MTRRHGYKAGKPTDIILNACATNDLGCWGKRGSGICAKVIVNKGHASDGNRILVHYNFDGELFATKSLSCIKLMFLWRLQQFIYICWRMQSDDR